MADDQLCCFIDWSRQPNINVGEINRYHAAFVLLASGKLGVRFMHAFSEWDRIFKDPMTTLAAVDRVVHPSVVLDLMNAESYRANTVGAKSKASPGKQPAAE